MSQVSNNTTNGVSSPQNGDREGVHLHQRDADIRAEDIRAIVHQELACLHHHDHEPPAFSSLKWCRLGLLVALSYSMARIHFSSFILGTGTGVALWIYNRQQPPGVPLHEEFHQGCGTVYQWMAETNFPTSLNYFIAIVAGISCITGHHHCHHHSLLSLLRSPAHLIKDPLCLFQGHLWFPFFTGLALNCRVMKEVEERFFPRQNSST